VLRLFFWFDNCRLHKLVIINRGQGRYDFLRVVFFEKIGIFCAIYLSFWVKNLNFWVKNLSFSVRNSSFWVRNL